MNTTTTVRLRWTTPPHPILHGVLDGATTMPWNPLIKLPVVGDVFTLFIADIEEEISVRVERVAAGITIHMSLGFASMVAELWVTRA